MSAGYKKIDQEFLKNNYDYRDDGNLIRKYSGMGNGNAAGIAIGARKEMPAIESNRNKRYVSAKILGKTYRLHQLIFLFHRGYMPMQLDHINNDSRDNRIENLREATASENACNRKTFKNNTSGVKGVSWHKKHSKWMVYIDFNKKRKTVGYFDDVELAELASVEARNKYHGQFANFN